MAKNVKLFFLTTHCFYNKLYLQRATRGDQQGKRGNDSMTFYVSDYEKFTKI